MSLCNVFIRRERETHAFPLRSKRLASFFRKAANVGSKRYREVKAEMRKAFSRGLRGKQERKRCRQAKATTVLETERSRSLSTTTVLPIPCPKAYC